MNRKPKIIGAVVLVLICCSLFFVKNHILYKPEQKEVISFLNGFNTELTLGTTQAQLDYFDDTKNVKLLKKILSILANKTSFNGKGKPLFNIKLLTDSTDVNVINTELTQATVPIDLNENAGNKQRSSINIQIRKNEAGKLKIIQIDARHFFDDYLAYENNIRVRNTPLEDIFEPITLKAFKAAASLKTKYDTIPLFQYVNGRTFYYVAKGDYKLDFYSITEKKHTYKMGLVDPNLKEIIPVKYDLIHNIGGTITDLIEVEDGDKKGFYDTVGKIVLSVDYDSILPLTSDENIAFLTKGNDHFYLKKDLTISEKLTDIKLTDVMKTVKNFNKSFKVEEVKGNDIMEYNSKDNYSSLVISPSYLVDWDILPQYIDLPNHLRKAPNNGDMEDEGHLWYHVDFNGTKADDKNWFETTFYSIIDNYVGSRAGLYETKNLLVVDKKSDKVLTFSAASYHGDAEGGGELSGKCNDNTFRQINDTLFEFMTTSQLEKRLYDGIMLDEGPYYHYLTIKNGKLVALPNQRIFGFTKYVKMDDSYLNGCYFMTDHSLDHMNTDMLRYAKNEIFAQYHYKFADQKWTDAFEHRFERYDGPLYTNVQDSLTVIDKYNISWLDKKIKAQKSNSLATK